MEETGAGLAAVVLAGQSIHKEDPLNEFARGGPKALIPIAGRPMVSYVLAALTGSRRIARIVVVGRLPEIEPALPLPIDLVECQGELIPNVLRGIQRAVELAPDLDGVLLTGSDLPLLTSAIVDEFVASCLETDHDAYYGIVERTVMEARFPTSRRTYVRLRDGEFAGGDLLLLRRGATGLNTALWHRLAEVRKNPLRQIWMLGGPGPVLKLLTHRMSLAEAEARASKAFNVRARVIVCPHPELGMDVDKPCQLDIVCAELGG
jgi:molybdopterin-guanine dinucleotide biosynthesis protein A